MVSTAAVIVNPVGTVERMNPNIYRHFSGQRCGPDDYPR